MSAYIKVAGRKAGFTYKYQDKYLYSVYDPIKEALAFIDKNVKPTSKCAVTICGADFVNEILLERGYRTIISIDVGLILQSQRDFEPTVSSDKIHRVVSIKEATDILLYNNISASELDLLIWSPYISTHLECGELLADIKSMCQLATANKLTADTFGKIELRNADRNLATLTEIPLLKKQNKAKLAIIIASGASLPRYVEELRLLSREALVVSLPSAMKYLTSENIQPDYCIVADPGYASLYHLDGLETDTTVICPLSINPAILRLPHVRPVFFDYGICEDKGIFNSECVRSVSEGSVCFNALRIVKQLGCSQALLLGQDFAFCEHRSHVAGGFFEAQYYNQTDYYNSMDRILSAIQFRNDPCTLEVCGRQFESDATLKIYYEHFIDTDFGIEILLPKNVFNPLSEKIKKI